MLQRMNEWKGLTWENDGIIYEHVWIFQNKIRLNFQLKLEWINFIGEKCLFEKGLSIIISYFVVDGIMWKSFNEKNKKALESQYE